jgi:hypothetical protein
VRAKSGEAAFVAASARAKAMTAMQPTATIVSTGFTDGELATERVE